MRRALDQPWRQSCSADWRARACLDCPLAFAMGVRNATIRRVAVPDLTTTVLTMTLTGLAADSQLFGGSGKGSVRRTTAVLAMLLGALSGALLLKTSLFLPLAVAAALAFITLLGYPPAARREEEA